MNWKEHVRSLPRVSYERMYIFVALICLWTHKPTLLFSKAKAVLSKNPKKRNQKRLQYAEDEYENARAVVVSERKFPSTLSFLFFFIFLPIGLLPPILRANKDSALPVYIYFLSAMTIKFYCNKFFGTQHPRGTEVGIFTYMESPQVNSLPACLLPGQDYYFALGHGSKTSGHSSCAPRLLLPTHEFDLRRTPQHADFAGTYLPWMARILDFTICTKGAKRAEFRKSPTNPSNKFTTYFYFYFNMIGVLVPINPRIWRYYIKKGRRSIHNTTASLSLWKFTSGTNHWYFAF